MALVPFTGELDAPPPPGFHPFTGELDTAPPSTLNVVGNAAYKGLGSLADFPLNIAGSVGNALIPPPLRPGAMQDPARKALTALGFIKPEHEPQTPEQRVLDTAVQGGVGMLANPVKGGLDVAKNIATGLIGGAAAQGTKEYTGSDAAATAVGLATPFALRSTARPEAAQANALRNETLRAAQAAGYKVPPSTVNPSSINETVESLAGKAAVKQQLALKNQEVTNALARQELGFPKNEAITTGKLEKMREAAAAPYREVASMSSLAATALEKLKQARADAKLYYNHFTKSADPSSLTKAKAETTKADMYETAIAKVAKQQGKPELVQELKDARREIAKTYEVERALNVGDANVDARTLGRALDKGKPLTGNLEIIGKFAEGPGRQFTGEGAAIPSPGVSGTDPAMAALLATAGYGAGGGVGMLAGGLPLARGPARAMATSNWYQNLMAQPNYGGVGMGDKALQAALLARAIEERNKGVLK